MIFPQNVTKYRRLLSSLDHGIREGVRVEIGNRGHGDMLVLPPPDSSASDFHLCFCSATAGREF